MEKYANVAEYMAGLPEMQQNVAQIMRDLLADAAPDAKEVLSYNMPAIKQNGKVLVYFAATQKHLGFYPTPAPIVAFEAQLKDFQTSKGTIQIPYDQPLPVKLIREIVAFRVEEVSGE
ncbi:iron chaperone [Pediococcus parvulus]|uniref:iron chaperone n=1 Tax=Pediococcus parvulus TaxID=54062 RepID=UPI00345E2DE6